MKTRFLILLLALVNQNCASLSTAPKREKSTDIRVLKKRFEEIIDTADPNINVGIQISSLKDGSVIYEKNASRHFIPGSTLKIVTLAAALHHLGPTYRFDTEIFAEGLNKEGTTVKSLYIKGSGDPSLMDHDLYNLAFELKQLGISHVEGNIYVDSEVFDDVLWAPGTSVEDRARGFAAPVSGLNLNYNRLLIKTTPAYNGQKLAYAIVKPATKYIKVKSNARTKSDNSGRNLSFSIEHKNGKKEEWPSPMSEGLNKGDTVVISGHMQKNSDPHYALMAVRDPAMLAGTYFKEQLKHMGIKVDGKVVAKVTPTNAVKLTSHQSRSLGEALIDFTKISNNIANDSLLKAISAQNGQRPATAKHGLKLASDFLAKEVGIDAGSLVAADGAGLSRYSLITPAQMVKILNYAALHFHMGPEFMAALPIAGQDGTLSRRLKDQRLKGNIRAKTGSMSGLHNLVGYISNNHGERFSFAFMINGFVGSAEKYIKMQEDFLAAMFDDPNQAVATKE
ncbi:MAG TPA: D-alanyl-D-alanine carboxypeptidase/D-alanyl-D-alanine-endopeptidase [Myxococcota bacterium]|nr:D-alanyl-D-alanine carboxypeptidase/D-alanyl-D-alanine-endopeptidase [Myxococcota bacterium]